MNHDYTHCIDYDADICPVECFRAELARDLIHTAYVKELLPFASLKGTEKCLRGDTDGSNN